MDADWSQAFDDRHGEPLKKLLEVDYPLRHDPKKAPILYGTSGFRTKGNLLAPVVMRVSSLMVFRSVAGGVTPCLPVGVIITASHNHNADNGLKLLECESGMLEGHWEPVAIELGNAATYDDFKAACWSAELVAKQTSVKIAVNTTPIDNEPLTEAQRTSVSGILIHAGRDTRTTGPELLEALHKGVTQFGGRVVDHGIVTTPVVHDVIYRLAKERKIPCSPARVKEHEQLRQLSEGGNTLPEEHTAGTKANYFRTTVESFVDFYTALAAWKKQEKKTMGSTRHFVVDCANGVGTMTCVEVQRRLALQANVDVKFHLLNTDVEDNSKLNEACGADLLQKTRRITPELLAKRKELMESEAKIQSDDIGIYTLDGDADRIVGFYVPAEAGANAKIEDAQLLDGDRIIMILATVMQKLLSAAQLAPKCGVVQTAYANGASTHYISQTLGLPPVCGATGVKNTHHIAASFDVGIYFESNGHGTILFDQLRFMPKVKALMRAKVGFSSAAALKDSNGQEIQTPAEEVPEPETPASPVPLQRHDAAKFIYLLSELASQSCGDAVADLLAIEAALGSMDWTFKDWFNAYEDLPSTQIKVPVTGGGNPCDLVKNTADQSKIVEPIALQNEIDRLVELHGGSKLLCRSFVRPSGTEPIVRVYAEATTKAACDGLGADVKEATQRILLS